MKLDKLTFEIKTKSGEYRPCLVSDMKGFFHMWTPEGKAIVEFDDGTVSTVKAEDIRFLDTESLMVEYACFSDEWIERFKTYGKGRKSFDEKCREKADKVSDFFEEFERLCNELGLVSENRFEADLSSYFVCVIDGDDVVGSRRVYMTDILFYDNMKLFAERVFNQIANERKEVE